MKLFSITRSSSFSVIQLSVNTKNNAEKDTTLLLSGRPCDFLANKTLSCIWVAIPVDWVILHWYACGADGRSLARSVYGHVITKFSRIFRLPHFLSYGAPLQIVPNVESQFHHRRPRRRDFPSPSVSAPGSPRMGQISMTKFFSWYFSAILVSSRT